jgi:hypothetical protein
MKICDIRATTPRFLSMPRYVTPTVAIGAGSSGSRVTGLLGRGFDTAPWKSEKDDAPGGSSPDRK